jgi:hypothetical protein
MQLILFLPTVHCDYALFHGVQEWDGVMMEQASV